MVLCEDRERFIRRTGRPGGVSALSGCCGGKGGRGGVGTRREEHEGGCCYY